MWNDDHQDHSPNQSSCRREQRVYLKWEPMKVRSESLLGYLVDQ